jgi:hypothetical protein
MKTATTDSRRLFRGPSRFPKAPIMIFLLLLVFWLRVGYASKWAQWRPNPRTTTMPHTAMSCMLTLACDRSETHGLQIALRADVSSPRASDISMQSPNSQFWVNAGGAACSLSEGALVLAAAEPRFFFVTSRLQQLIREQTSTSLSSQHFERQLPSA